MRVEEYTCELTGSGYRILSTSDVYWAHSAYYGTPIEMSMTYLHDGDKHPLHDNLEELIRAADVELVDDEDEANFMDLYPEIMRGNCPGWQLGEVQVYSGGIMLAYGNTYRSDIGRVYIEGLDLALTFKGARTRLGFDPVYKVHVKHNPDGTHCFTMVDEDLGYIRRIISFALKEQADPKRACLGENQIIHVVEHVGM